MTQQGYSISMAFMPPKYMQVFHYHPISEYTLPLDRKTIGLAKLNGKNTKIVANKNEILHFCKYTIHSLYNTSFSVSRNITTKSPAGVMNWTPALNSEPIKATHCMVIGNKLSKIKNGTKIIIPIQDAHYNYNLEILQLNKKVLMEDVYEKDKYFFVIDGNLELSSKGIKKQAGKNDYIVIDKNSNFKIKTKTRTSLYTVNIKKYRHQQRSK